MRFLTKSSRPVWLVLLITFGSLGFIASCTHEDTLNPSNPDVPSTLEPLDKQVRVQVAYDATEVAIKFVWKTQEKLYPEGMANVGKNYPMQFHDILQHDGTKFDRFPSAQRLQEDRITFMIDKHEGGIQGYARMGCGITCHTGMEDHNLLTNDVLDHWHYRAARSGPMGYAEDVAVDNVSRIRDDLGTMPTKFLRSGGDRLRENQSAIIGSGHPVLEDGLPRFVFNKGKSMPGGFVVPGFFLPNRSNTTMIDSHIDIPQIKDVSNNISLLVVYQDRTFDPIEKVNAIDLGYLAWLATGMVAHLPAHLRDETSADFTAWKNYWATETGISTEAAAITKLDQVHQEWVASGKKAMVTRSVGFIYNSDQHDITSERDFNADRNEWTVILKRKLSTGSAKDANLSTLPNGGKFTISFAMHDSGAGSETHDISLPYEISNADNADLQAKQVSSISNVEWGTVPALDTYWVKQAVMPRFTNDWLRSGAHPGSGSIESTKCITCHTESNNVIFTQGVLN
ncbi:ethylbenzene dehydrogenase-related protein [Aquiflexum lacus]|uniref:ethylbenzene dehydrogenase-related protein n=1 Tax=Aquiflexum lacus TaxID=2483805 RepID=UPI001894416D|nr:ethylbenzene dehydrogenase-related protein [Aquiflexum lacus]